MKRKRRIRRPPRRRTGTQSGAAARPRTKPVQPVFSAELLRIVACGAVFVALVTLKLVRPDGLASVRETLGDWLVRDADFVSAFSAVGHAVSGEGGVLDSLEDAYVAVFGEEEATEVSGGAEIEVGDAAPGQDAAERETAQAETRAYPERAAAEQRILGFDYAPPLRGEVTSPFGWREHPATGREAFHYGVDIAAEEGAEIDCFADGTVGVVGESVELGKYLTVHHANGVLTLYAHCSRVTVSPDEAVKRGDKLAEAGSTGNATGPHLHFEIQDGEDYLDPAYYLGG